MIFAEETRPDVGAHIFYKQGTTTIFDVHIGKLDTGSYLCMMPGKTLANANKNKREKYLQP